jgi:hypothetical protein
LNSLVLVPTDFIQRLDGLVLGKAHIGELFDFVQAHFVRISVFSSPLAGSFIELLALILELIGHDRVLRVV